MAETIIKTKDYRSDIVLTMHMTLGGETVNVPQHDFLLRFFTENNARHYDCGRIKGEWLHCAPDASDATLLTCYIKNHGLGCGMLQCTYIDLSPNDGMEDGVQRTFSVSGLDLELVDDASDDTQAVSGSVAIDINAVLADLHDAADAAIASQQKNIASIVYLASDQPGGQNTITITQNDGTVISGTVLNGKGADDDYVKDVKLNGRSVVTNKGVAMIVTEASQLPALVTIDGMRKENVLDALEALNQYISSVEESIDEHGGETELVFGSLNNGIFYDINGNEAVRSTTLLYIDRSTGIIYRWGTNSFEQVGGKDLGEYSLKNVPFLENPDTSNPDVFNIYKTYEDYVAWLRDDSASRLMTVAELLAYLDANIGQYVLALDAASSPEYIQRLSVAGGIASQSSATSAVDLRSHDNAPGLKISFAIDRTATNTGTTLTAERSTGITTASYNGNTKVNEVSIAPAGVISKTASGVTKTFNLPAESGTLALQSEVAAKQDALVSGQNIKSINGQSVLGGGNMTIHEEQLIEKSYAPAEFSGLGRKYLQKNIVSDKNVLTQAMMNDANTIYVIQYDYDLNGASITVPSGCVLQFDGGSLSDGTITGNGTTIDAGNTKIFDSVTFSGSFSGALNALWIGAKANDSTFDNSPILQAWFTSYSDYFRVIEFPLDNYYFLTPCVKSDVKRFREIRGNNSNFYVNIADDGDKGQYFLTIQGENFTIKDVSIRNSRKTTVGSTDYDLTKTRCLYLKQAQLFSLSGVTIQYFDVGVYIEDIWYGGFSGMNALANNRIGVLAIGVTSSEVNTIDFRNLRMRGISVATAQAVWPQNDGESDADYAMRTASVALDFHCISNNCKFDSVTIEGFDYGIRFNYLERSSGNGSMHGVANITKCYFEANRVYDIYTGQGWVIRDRGYTYNLYTIMTLLIDSCLFHTLKKCYFRDAYVTMISCHEQCEVQLSVSNSGCDLVHDGSAICKSDYSTQTALYTGGWSVNGYTGFTNNLQTKLENSEGDKTLLRPYDVAYRLNQTYNSNVSSFTVGSVVRRTFEMYPSVGMQGIIQPLRCYYDSQNNKLFTEVTSGGTKRMAQLSYRFAMRVLGAGKTSDIPLYEFFRRWDNGVTYTGEVGHLFPFTITADPSTGLITTSSGSIIGFGKKALIDGTFTPSGTNWWIDVDSMCVVRYSYSSLKRSSDLVQCARSYIEILPDEDSSTSSATTRRYSGTTNQRESSVTPHVNAIYFNTDIQNYQIFNGTQWVTLTTRYQRYEYVNHGSNLLSRPKVADFPDQTFTDDSTGITYIFKINDAKTSYSWVSISDKSGATIERPLLSWGEDGYNFYDTTIMRNIYSKIGKAAEITQVIPTGGSAQAVTIDNTLIEGQMYWCSYDKKQSWGGMVSFRKTTDSSEGQLTILSNFNSNDKGVYFTAPSPTEYPYIYMSNSYSVAETVTFELPTTSWVEEDGATAGVARSGDTASRPASTGIYTGFQYWDTDLGKMIAWNGTAWVDSSSIKNISTIPATGLLPNVVYNYGTTDTVSVTLAAGEAGVANIWCFVFTAQTAACTVTLPSGVVLGNEYAWDMVAGRRYEVSIMDNVAIVNYSD